MNILISNMIEEHVKKENFLCEIIIKEKQAIKKKFKQNHPIFFANNNEKRYSISDFYYPDCNLIMQIDNLINCKPIMKKN